MTPVIDAIASLPGYVHIVLFGGLGLGLLTLLDRWLMRPVEMNAVAAYNAANAANAAYAAANAASDPWAKPIELLARLLEMTEPAG